MNVREPGFLPRRRPGERRRSRSISAVVWDSKPGDADPRCFADAHVLSVQIMYKRHDTHMRLNHQHNYTLIQTEK